MAMYNGGKIEKALAPIKYMSGNAFLMRTFLLDCYT
jgi:hypothetical protein